MDRTTSSHSDEKLSHLVLSFDRTNGHFTSFAISFYLKCGIMFSYSIPAYYLLGGGSMAKTGKKPKITSTENYRYDEQEVLLRPDIGLQAQFKKKKTPKLIAMTHHLIQSYPGI